LWRAGRDLILRPKRDFTRKTLFFLSLVKTKPFIALQINYFGAQRWLTDKQIARRPKKKRMNSKIKGKNSQTIATH
jgi:hypothetical protein